MILPRHAVEANMWLSKISEITEDYEDRIEGVLKNGNFSYENDLSVYIKKMLTTVALLAGELSELEKSALSMFGVEDAEKSEIRYLQTVPPHILYEAFVYQNLSGDVILPDLLAKMKTIIMYIGQIGDIDKANDFYNEIVSTYQHALEALQRHINLN